MKPFWIGATLFGIIFAVLLSFRLNSIQSSPAIFALPEFRESTHIPERDVWMNIFQNGKKIGFSHSVLLPTEKGYTFQETVQMSINTMGVVQKLALRTKGTLLKDFSLSSFEFSIDSGRFSFSAAGTADNQLLNVHTETAGQVKKISVGLENRIYLAAGMVHSLSALDLDTDEEISFSIFDPLDLGQNIVRVRMLGSEDIRLMNQVHSARKVSFTFKGSTQLAWIDDKGDILKESGLLGIEMERTTREDALYGQPIESNQDLTKVASIKSNRIINNPEALNRIAVRIEGIDPESYSLNNFRQAFQDTILTVRKESLRHSEKSPSYSKPLPDEYLMPTPLIQSDHPDIINLSRRITATAKTPFEKVEEIVAWIYTEIEKRPVLSVPDALSTLKHRMGDCNEHSVLFAALARAAGIPATLEVGLVYLKGRFYYHAWNAVFIGKWISVDSLFNQIPADVTHLRFAGGSDNLPTEIVGLIGKIKIEIMELDG